MPTLAESLGKELKTILAFVGVIWAVYFISFLLPVTEYGLQPRTAWGLLGIVTMPLLHASLGQSFPTRFP